VEKTVENPSDQRNSRKKNNDKFLGIIKKSLQCSWFLLSFSV